MTRFFFHLAEEMCEQVHVPPNMVKYLEGIPEIRGRFTSRLDEESVNHFHYDCGDELDNEGCAGAEHDWGITFDVNLHL